MTEPKTEMDTIFVPATSTTSTNGVVVTASQQDSSPTSTSNVVVVDGSQSSVVQQQHAQTQVLTETPQGTVIQLTNGTNGPGPGLQKVVLEDIRLEDYYNETMEESLCKQFKFQITHNELKMMIENSVLETNTAKPYRYLTGNFIRVFERHVEVFEKQKIPIQKRNNVVYEESLRNNTVYMRVNGDCKLCPKANRVRYVFIIKQKPDQDDKYVEVEAKIRGTHQHDPSMIGNASMDSTTGTPSTSHKSSTARKHTSRLSLSVLNANMSSTPGGTDSTVDTSTGGHHSHKRPRISHKTEATTIQLADPQQLANGSFLSTSPRQNQTNPLAAAANNSSFVTTTAALNLLDKNVINQIANQISSKIMIKLDQINLKVNQISDRLYDLERKLDSVEVAEIQF